MSKSYTDVDKLLLRLEEWGCDIKSALERVLQDKELLVICIFEVSKDKSFNILGDSLIKNDIKSAFEAAHTLKGIIANTGITPLYEIIVEIVEPLRNEKQMDLIPSYKKLISKNHELKEILNDYNK